MDMPTTTAADPAPALGRGIAILRHLEREGSCSLEQLARHFRWPKASLLRLTESLRQAGVVVRDPLSKRYRALVQLVGQPMAQSSSQPLPAERSGAHHLQRSSAPAGMLESLPSSSSAQPQECSACLA